MNRAEAVELISPAFEPGASNWLDLGAGSGTFTEALAHLVGSGGSIYAIDRDAGELRELERAKMSWDRASARVTTIEADVETLTQIPELGETALHGALLANLLHYFAEPERILRRVAARLAEPACVIVVEYDRKVANRWVPHPIDAGRFPAIVAAAGLDSTEIVAWRGSRFGGRLYCARVWA